MQETKVLKETLSGWDCIYMWIWSSCISSANHHHHLQTFRGPASLCVLMCKNKGFYLRHDLRRGTGRSLLDSWDTWGGQIVKSRKAEGGSKQSLSRCYWIDSLYSWLRLRFQGEAQERCTTNRAGCAKKMTVFNREFGGCQRHSWLGPSLCNMKGSMLCTHPLNFIHDFISMYLSTSSMFGT